MSDFKFTCPVCGQHIAAEASASGRQIECPTCFQKIIIPSAPRSDSKYILSATQVIKSEAGPPPPPRRAAGPSPTETTIFRLVAAVAVLCAAGAALYLFFGKFNPPQTPASTRRPPGAPVSAWTLDLARATVPKTPAAGEIHGHRFTCDHAVMHPDALVLRQGTNGLAQRLVLIRFPLEDRRLAPDQSFLISPRQTGARPRVLVRWMQADLFIAQVFTNGYAMKLDFGKRADGKVPGRIYLCLPDTSRSFVAGAFDAEWREPAHPAMPDPARGQAAAQ